MMRLRATSAIVAVTLALAAASRVMAADHGISVQQLTKLEADYILACQFLKSQDPADGAINNIYGAPTWVVPRENALAILGLIEASKLLQNPEYRERAELAADYLIRVQDPTDGAWVDQYAYASPVLLSKSPTQTAEVMMAFYRLGFKVSRYAAMKHGAQFLLACQDPANKGGNDDGLLGGGKDAQGQFATWRWASDNAFAYQALKAAQAWATAQGDSAFADQCDRAASRIIQGINEVLYVADRNDPDYGVWRRVVDHVGQPVDPAFHELINYAPQMLDLPARGVGSSLVGDWIHRTLQQSDGACVWDDGAFRTRKSPGFSFQASLAWLDLGQTAFADAAKDWAEHSGLWQTTLDPNGVQGGWIDWREDGQQADWWLRFIDTSFYAIAVFNGGYDFRTAGPSVDRGAQVGMQASVGAVASMTVTPTNISDGSPAGTINFGAVTPGATPWVAAPQYLRIQHQSNHLSWAVRILTDNRAIFPTMAGLVLNDRGTPSDPTDDQLGYGGMIGTTPTDPKDRVSLAWQVYKDPLSGGPVAPTDAQVGGVFNSPWAFLADASDCLSACTTANPVTIDKTLEFLRVAQGDSTSGFLLLHPDEGNRIADGDIAVYLAARFGAAPTDSYHTTIIVELYHF